MNRRDVLRFVPAGFAVTPVVGHPKRGQLPLSGCFWYERSGDLYRVKSGDGKPQRVNWLRRRNRGVSSFRVSANGRHYLQMSNYDDASGRACELLYFDAETNEQRGFLDMNGYVVDARVSPSGKYIAMVRSPDYMNTLNLHQSKNIAGLTVVDVSDKKQPRTIRSTFDRNGASAIQFQWHGNDEYVYMTLDGSLYGGPGARGQAGERRLGRFLSSTMIKGEFSLHPNATTFLMKGRKGPNDYDIYLCGIDGRVQRQMTSVGRAYDPLWSPDGSLFMFKGGSNIGCSDPGCGGTCVAYFASASASYATEKSATLLDGLLVPCSRQFFWTADPQA
jgi:hypothetical protein